MDLTKRLAEAIEGMRNQSVDGFEDFFFLTYKQVYADLKPLYSESKVWEILQKVYVEVWKQSEEIPSPFDIKEISIRKAEKEEVEGEVIEESQEESKVIEEPKTVEDSEMVEELRIIEDSKTVEDSKIIDEKSEMEGKLSFNTENSAFKDKKMVEVEKNGSKKQERLQIWFREKILEITNQLEAANQNTFSKEPLYYEDKFLQEKAENILIGIEDELGFFKLEGWEEEAPNSKENVLISRMRKPSNKLALSLITSSIFLMIAMILIFSLVEASKQKQGKETKIIESSVVETTAQELTTINAEDVSEASFGWNKYEKGWKYKKVDGSFILENWLEEDVKLYYFDDSGYMVTGFVTLGEQTFQFAESGELEKIVRANYDIEQMETDLGRQLDQQGLNDLKTYIVNDSIVNEDGWIYYLSKENQGNSLPDFIRLKDGAGKLEMISDEVSGYVIVGENAWYYTDDKLLYFVTSNQADLAGDNALVTDSEGRYLLQDAAGNQVSTKEAESIQIGPRIYHLQNGAIISVERIPTMIGGYTFMRSEADYDNNIYTEDGKKFLTQGFWITDMCVVGNELYYSTIIRFDADKKPISQLYKIDINSKQREAITGLFEGRVEKMYYYPENSAIFMEFSPIGANHTYGRVLEYNLSESKLYLLNDETERELKGASAMSRLKVITTNSNQMYCYIEEGTYNEVRKDMDVISLSTITLDIENKSPYGE